MIAHILPQRRHEDGAEGSLFITKPDFCPVIQSDAAQKDVQNAVIRVIYLQPQLADNDRRNQHRHKVDGKEHSLAFNLLAERQRQSKRQRQLEKDRQPGQQQGVAQRLHKADGIAVKQFLVVVKSDKSLRTKSVPVKKAVIDRCTNRRNQNAAEKDQRRQQKNENMPFVAVLFLHRVYPL